MALGRYSRVDGRKPSSSYCSTVVVVVFVALCAAGVWMMTSSTFVPVPKIGGSGSSETENTNDVNVKEQLTDNGDSNLESESKKDNNDNEGKVKQFEDNPGDLPDEATKGDNNVNTNQEETDNIVEVKKNEETEDKVDGKKKSDENDVEDSEAGQKSDTDEKEKETETSDGSKDEETTEATKDSGDEVFPSGAQSEILVETTTKNGGFPTQEAISKNEKEAQESSEHEKQSGYEWKLCNVTARADYIPCLDNLQAIKHLHNTKHYEHRERHCPDDPPTCLVSLPEGYQISIKWPTSREKIWYHNVPHTKLAEVKGHQNWVKVTGEYLTFPGGGTQFKNGALHYIDFIQQSVPDIAWGKRSRVVLDVGCGVASFGGFLFDRDVLTMSLAPKDEHEAQTQFALERGIPAISAVMGTKRLPFPGRAFDVVHCARCRVPWHIEGGKLLLELNRLLRPGGFFVWSATPVYQTIPEDVEIWEVRFDTRMVEIFDFPEDECAHSTSKKSNLKNTGTAMKKLTKAMCWKLVSITKDKVNSVGIAVYRKPMTNECYEQRAKMEPPLCSESDDPSAAWYVPLQACIHKVPTAESERGSKWPKLWPARLQKPPYWLSKSQVGVYGKQAPDDFVADYEHWKRVVNNSYLNGLGIDWSTVRNVMDMRAIYGGFAAALRDKNVWVMNIVSIDAPDTLPIIYERGLFGIYHDWCESFSTYPRSYDLLHADHLFSKIKKKCNFAALVAEVDRILRPGGKLIVRDQVETIGELESMLKSMQWEIRITYAKDDQGLLCAQKSMWRPNEWETVTYAIA